VIFDQRVRGRRYFGCSPDGYSGLWRRGWEKGEDVAIYCTFILKDILSRVSVGSTVNKILRFHTICGFPSRIVMDLRVTALTGRETLCIFRANMKKTLVYNVNEQDSREMRKENREQRDQSLLR